jgi:5-methylcytosine-specific restriction protein A
MAQRVARLCTYPGCPSAGSYRGRCAEHATQREVERNQRRDESRSVYLSSQWRRLRRMVLLENPYCVFKGCPQLATDVDHIVPISQGGDPWSRANMQGLCHSHHSQKSASETRTNKY